MAETWALPEQLRRARTSLGLSVHQASELLGVSAGVLEAWERGESEPDEDQLWELGEAYARPVAYFFSLTSHPPPRQDFRADRPLDPEEEIGARKAAVARFEELCRVQHSLERLVGEEAEEPLLAALRAEAPSIRGAEDLAAWVRQRLGLGDGPVKDVRQLLEAMGVRVFATDVPSGGFAGTCWWHDEFGPAILLNRRDPEPRRAFTAAHEVAHLLRINDQTLCGFLESDAEEERFANRFAAAFLMPEGGVRSLAQDLRAREEIAGWDTLDNALDKVARHYGVSREAAAWRLEGLELLPKGFTAVRRTLWASRPFFRGKRGARWRHRLQDLGPKHLRLARRAYEDGKLSVAALARALQLEPEEAYELTETVEPPES